MPRHKDTDPLSKEMGGTFQRGGDYGFLTTSIITNATSNQDLQDDMETGWKNGTAQLLHGDIRPALKRCQDAVAKGNNADFDVENADVTGATTVASLVALTALGANSNGVRRNWTD